MESIEHGAGHVVGEAFDELVGRSKRSWALILVAFVLGAVATAVVVIKLASRGSESAGRPDAHDIVTPSETQASEARCKESAWARRRAQIGRTEATMRARAGGLGSRVHDRVMHRGPDSAS